MIEVFITNIHSQPQVDKVFHSLMADDSKLKIDFDFNETGLSFPCGHTILRIEGDTVNPDKIIATVNQSGFKCENLEDKVCR